MPNRRSVVLSGMIKKPCFFQDGTRKEGSFGEPDSRGLCVVRTPYPLRLLLPTYLYQRSAKRLSH